MTDRLGSDPEAVEELEQDAEVRASSTAREMLDRIAPFSIEIILLVEIALLHLLLARSGIPFGVLRIVESLKGTSFHVAGLILAGMALRLLWLLARSRRAEAREWISDSGWWARSARYAVVAGLLAHFYTWLKVFVPVIHRQLFDAQLYEIDRMAMLGLQPNVFFVNLFSSPFVIRLIDLGYSEAFMAVLLVSIAWILSSRDESVRRSFTLGFVLLWSAGSWLYLAIPALGPCFAFPLEFAPFREQLRGSMTMQALLFQNYQRVIRVALGHGEQFINPLFGVAAFPSLHVGHVAFVALWARRIARPLWLPFALLVGLMFFGSIVTGWHYMVDSIAGLLLAWLAIRVTLPRESREAMAMTN